MLCKARANAHGRGARNDHFDKRKEGYESKFARDEELRFKATARRNKLLGLWAAEKLGKTGDDAQTYAREVIRADMQEAGDEDVFRKIRARFRCCRRRSSRTTRSGAPWTR